MCRRKGTLLRGQRRSLEQAEKTFAVQQVQYQRGMMISQMAFADAQDSATEAGAGGGAEEPRNPLFTSYRHTVERSAA